MTIWDFDRELRVGIIKPIKLFPERDWSPGTIELPARSPDLTPLDFSVEVKNAISKSRNLQNYLLSNISYSLDILV